MGRNADESDARITDALNRLQFLLARPIDFRLSDTQTTLAKVRMLSAAATYFNIIAVTDFGGRSGEIRAPGLVEQVIGAAFQTFGGQDPHPTPFDKAAMLLRGITQGHPFTDGNKRTGFLMALYYLELVGVHALAELPKEQVISLCLNVSAGRIRAIDDIAAELERLWIS